jgi:hypothetical protein
MDPESSAGGRVAAGRASYAGHVEGDDPDEKRYPDRLNLELEREDIPPPPVIKVDVETISEMPRRGLINRKRSGCKEKDLTSRTWNVRTLIKTRGPILLL